MNCIYSFLSIMVGLDWGGGGTDDMIGLSRGCTLGESWACGCEVFGCLEGGLK